MFRTCFEHVFTDFKSHEYHKFCIWITMLYFYTGLLLKPGPGPGHGPWKTWILKTLKIKLKIMYKYIREQIKIGNEEKGY